MKTLELAQAEEINICTQIIDEGKAFQKEQGFVQWTDDYPNMDIIKKDIQNNKGYVIKVNEEIAGYMCIDFGGEPAYDTIEGQWQTEKPYAVVHRMAFRSAFRGIGLAETAFRLVATLCLAKGIHSIRIDTDFSNTRMQHILEKSGFTRRGIVVFQESEKIAYDKRLS